MISVKMTKNNGTKCYLLLKYACGKIPGKQISELNQSFNDCTWFEHYPIQSKTFACTDRPRYINLSTQFVCTTSVNFSFFAIIKRVYCVRNALTLFV